MAHASELLARSRATLGKYPALWLPPIAINAFQSLAGVPMTNPAPQALVGVTAYMATFIIAAGWLQMIGVALKEERPGFKAFKEGVNAHWGHMVLGHVVFFLILGAALAALAWVGEQQYGFAPLMEWYKQLVAMTPAEQQAAVEPAALPAAVRGWMSLFLVGLGIGAVMTFLLLFWQPLVVLAGQPWWKAWGKSVQLVFRRFKLAFGFAALHGVLFFATLTLTASGNAFFTIVGLTMLLFVTIFFKIAYAAVVVDSCLPAEAEA